MINGCLTPKLRSLKRHVCDFKFLRVGRLAVAWLGPPLQGLSLQDVSGAPVISRIHFQVPSVVWTGFGSLWVLGLRASVPLWLLAGGLGSWPCGSLQYGSLNRPIRCVRGES